MRAVVQRVTEATVTVDDGVVGTIGVGLLVLVGVTHDDNTVRAEALADKLFHLRILDDSAGVMNRSLADSPGAVLVVSQFTLYGDTSHGRRPSWKAAAPSEQAEPLVARVVEVLRDRGLEVATGCFGAEMQVSLINDGPVTVLLEL